MSGNSPNLAPGLTKDDCRNGAPDRQPTCGDQAPTAISTAAGQHHDLPPGQLPAQPAAGMSSQATPRVLHHLQQLDMKFVDHDPVDLPHLGNGHGRDDAHTVLAHTVLAHTFTALGFMTKSPWSRNLHPRRRCWPHAGLATGIVTARADSNGDSNSSDQQPPPADGRTVRHSHLARYLALCHAIITDPGSWTE